MNLIFLFAHHHNSLPLWSYRNHDSLRFAKTCSRPQKCDPLIRLLQAHSNRQECVSIEIAIVLITKTFQADPHSFYRNIHENLVVTISRKTWVPCLKITWNGLRGIKKQSAPPFRANEDQLSPPALAVADPDLKLRRARGHFDLLALLAFLRTVISSFSTPKYKGGGPGPSARSATALFPINQLRVYQGLCR